MEQQWSSVQGILTALVAVVLLLIAVKKNSGKRTTPPGPWGWPVLGSLPLLGTLPHHNLAKLAKKYGPLMFMKLGSVNVLVVSSPKLAEEFLKTQDKIWASRFATTAVQIMSYNGVDIAFSEYGPRWRYAKKIFLLELLTAKRMSDFKKTRKQEIMGAIKGAIDRCCSGTKSVPMDMVLGKIAMNIVTRMLMNEGSLNDKATTIKNSDEFHQMVKDGFELSGAFYLGDFIPWLDRIDLQGYKKKMVALSKKYDEFMQSILDDHMTKLEAAKQNPLAGTDNTVQDMVDTLLTRPRDGDGEYLTPQEMKGIMQDVIFGGTDTNSNTIEWGLSELLKNPQVLKKAQAEMDSVVGKERLVEESDMPNLPYLNAIVKETFRLHPVAPLLIPHVSMEDCEVQGYKIPAKTRLFVNVHALQRDPDVYDTPLEFSPERFLGSEKDVHGLHFDLLPFGSGRRICPGRVLGLLLVQYCMAAIIQTCNLSLPGNMKPDELDMEEKFGLTMPRFNPLQAVLVPRVPEQLFNDF